jgi:diguanylate cyclase (GGDEF)-like protein
MAHGLSAQAMDDVITGTIDTSVDQKEAKRQAHRRRMSFLAIVHAMIQCGVLALFAAAGTIPVSIALAFFAASMVSTIAAYFIVRLGLNRKLREPGMLVPQILVNGSIQLIFLFLAPNLSVLFLLALFLLLSYGAIQFTPRQFIVGWLVYGGATGLVLFLVRGRFGYPGVSSAEIALVWLFFFLALRQHTLVSGQVSHLRKQLTEKNRQLQVSLAKIEDLASHDYLTGVLNRRSLIGKLEAELQRVYRTGHPFCFVMVDLDHFKEINDRFGHPVGDQVLKKVSECANKSLRALDRFGRLGGEEFGIILPATWLDQGMIAMERMRKSVIEFDWESIQPGLRVTFSAGITTNAPGDTEETISRRADAALYKAKHEGRDRIEPAEEALPEMPAVDPDD